jgi:predicted component of type VI protein secretion system
MPKLQVILSDDNEVTHDLDEDRITIGRLPDNALQIDDNSVSSHHAELLVEGNSYRVRDLSSTNGTFVNGEAVTDVVLASGDTLRIGRVESVFSSDVNRGDAAHPIPESPAKTATVAALSARPVDFVSASPVPRGGKDKDPIGMALYALAALGVVTVAAAAYFVFSGVV